MQSNQGLTAQLIRSSAALRQLQPVWEQLYLSLAEPNPFLCWQWQWQWWDSYGGGPSRELAVVVVRRGPQVVGIAPLFVQDERFRHLSLRTVRFIASDEVCSDYLDLLVEPGEEEPVLEAVIGLLRQRLDWDVLCLSDVPEASRTPAALHRLTDRLDLSLVQPEHVLCPVVDLPGSWEAFLARLSYKTRKEVRRKLKRFHKTFETELKVIADGRQLDWGVEQLMRLNRLRLAQKHESGAFTDEHFTAFHSKAIPALVHAGHARIFLLQANGHPVAAQYLLTQNGRWYSYQGGFDPGYTRYAPGSVLDAMLLRHAIEQEQVKLFDFLRGEESYKMRFGAHTRRNLELVVFNLTVRALVALALHRTVSLVRNARAYRAARQTNGKSANGHARGTNGRPQAEHSRELSIEQPRDGVPLAAPALGDLSG